MLLKAYNKSLTQDKEKTYLTAAIAVAATTITVQAVDTTSWADNDYFIIGDIGSNTAEVLQVNGAVVAGTSLTIDNNGSGGSRFSHAIGEPIQRIDFNQVEFSRSLTDTISGVSVLATNNLQVDDEFTRYNDNSNTSGYGFIRFKNSTSSVFSSYSDGVNYNQSEDSSSRDPRTLWQMRKKVRKIVDEEDDSKISDDDIDEAINDVIRDLAHKRLWSFFESERSFSSVADQFAYTIPATIQKIYSVRFDTQPLVPINKVQFDDLNWDTDASSADPWNVAVWNRQILTYPRPSSSAATTTLTGTHTATGTTITVASTSSFKRGDYYRFIINSEVIYATASTTTTFTGASRGQEGTTAASHSNSDTVKERDIVYNGHTEPTDLINIQDRTPVPEPEVIVNGAGATIAFNLEKETLADRLTIKYENGLKELEEKYSSKQTAFFGRVKDKNEIPNSISRRVDPNQYPSNITGS